MSDTNQNESGHVPISSFIPGMQAEGIYHLQNVEQRAKRNGEPFFMMKLGDATGTVDAIMWDNHAGLVSQIIEQDDFVEIAADVGEYNGSTQLVMRKISRVEDSQVDLVHFLPVSPRPLDEMEKELDEWIAKVTNSDCQKLLERLFGHPRLREMYTHAPAAARIHQAYIHGLLEHTLAVMRLAWAVADGYEPVNRDLLITGTLIHDIGKIRELDWKRTITYTTEGRLLGHISMGAAMIDAMINEIRRRDSFDKELQMQILHMILSHHGKLEYGSPVVPKTREALCLHYGDNTEAYMAAFVEEVDKASARGERWTSFNKMFESYLYAGDGSAPLHAPGGDAPPADSGHPIEDVKTVR